MSDKGITIETFKDLRSFFYEGLSHLNKKSLCPVADEVVIYSSDVLEQYSLSSDLYSEALGLNLLKAQELNQHEEKIMYKNVGDTALVLVGYFSPAIKTKIISKDYYIKIGQMAYQRMNSIYPDYLDIPGFYKLLSDSFEGLTTLMKVFSEKNQQDPFKHLLLGETSEREFLAQGITPLKTNKVS